MRAHLAHPLVAAPLTPTLALTASVSVLKVVNSSKGTVLESISGSAAVLVITGFTWLCKLGMIPLADAIFTRAPYSVAYATRLTRALFTDFLFLIVEPFTASYFLSLLSEIVVSVGSTLDLHNVALRAAVKACRGLVRRVAGRDDRGDAADSRGEFSLTRLDKSGAGVAAGGMETRSNPMYASASPAGRVRGPSRDSAAAAGKSRSSSRVSVVANATMSDSENARRARAAVESAHTAQRLLRRADMVLFRDVVGVTTVFMFMLFTYIFHDSKLLPKFRWDVTAGFSVTVLVMAVVRTALFFALRAYAVRCRERLVEIADEQLAPDEGSKDVEAGETSEDADESATPSTDGSKDGHTGKVVTAVGLQSLANSLDTSGSVMSPAIHSDGKGTPLGDAATSPGVDPSDEGTRVKPRVSSLSSAGVDMVQVHFEVRAMLDSGWTADKSLNKFWSEAGMFVILSTAAIVGQVTHYAAIASSQNHSAA